METIYSNLWENVILWDDEIPVGKRSLDVDATDLNLKSLYDSIFLSEIGAAAGGDPDTVHEYQQIVWDLLWKNSRVNDCYVWINDDVI